MEELTIVKQDKDKLNINHNELKEQNTLTYKAFNELKN